MNLQPLIDNAHLIIPGVALVLFALPKLFTALGALFKGEDWFEKTAPKLQWAADQFAAARNWYSEAQEKLGLPKVPGLDKAKEVEDLVKKVEKLIGEKKFAEAFAVVASYKAGAADQMKKAGLPVPFASPTLPTTPSLPGASGAGDPAIGPDDPAQ